MHLLLVLDQFEEILILSDAAARAPLVDLLRGLITVSLETMKIVDALPPLRLKVDAKPQAAE